MKWDVMLSTIIRELIALLIVMTKCVTKAAQRKKRFTESHLETTAHHDGRRHTSSARTQMPLTLRVSFSHLSSPNPKCPGFCAQMFVSK